MNDQRGIGESERLRIPLLRRAQWWDLRDKVEERLCLGAFRKILIFKVWYPGESVLRCTRL